MKKGTLQALGVIAVVEKNLEKLRELLADARVRGDRDVALELARGIEGIEAQLEHLRDILSLLPRQSAPRGVIEKAVRRAKVRFHRLATRHEKQ